MCLRDLPDVMRNKRIPLCVAVVDLDHFEAINDRHGHYTSDRVFVTFASHQWACGLWSRRVASAWRVLLLTLPDATLLEALATVQHLRYKLVSTKAGAFHF